MTGAKTSARVTAMMAPAPGIAAAGIVSMLSRAIAARRKSGVVSSEHARSVQAAIDRILDAGAGLSLRCDQEERLVILNETPIPEGAKGRGEALLAQFAAMGISEIRVTRSLNEAEATKLLSILRRADDATDPRAACRKVLEGLWETGLRGTVDIVSLEQLGHAFARTVKVDGETRARLVYARVLAILSDYLAHEASTELQRYLGWKLVRSVNALVDLALEDERRLLGLAAVRGADNYIVNHAANTAALSVLVGKKIGLPRALLVQLGFAALFHGSGRLRTPPSVVNKPASARTLEEAVEFARHPYRGVGAVLEQRRLEDPVATTALVVFQYDARRGVPVTRAPLTSIHPLSQIVALCQAFDAHATSRAAPPFESLAAATQDPTRPYDPVLVHILGALVAALPSS